MIKKSLSDKRNYRLIKLSNNLRALLVHDPEADASSASVAVRVGAFSDPKEFPGLAHFCEHMLFMGTQKYPASNDFSEYLNANNGYSNAFTDVHATVYKFESSNTSFLPALDRFSQFFVSPLFDQSTVEKELKAIESENQKNLQSDVWRSMQLVRSESKSDSINHIFATGNSKTLNPNDNISEPRDALIKFYEEYYHACRMNLVVDSPIELDQIETAVKEYFSGIKPGNGELINYCIPEKPAYDSSNLSRYYVYEGIADKDKLKIQWFLPNALKYYKEKPLNYLSSLFGHEGKNSLFSTLIEDGLATELVAGPYDVTNIFSVFYISIALTEKGLKSKDEIVERVLKFIKLIQHLPINKRFYEESKIVKQITFDYKNREKPIDYAEDLAYTLHEYDDENILTGPYLFENYNEELIGFYLNELNFKNMNIYLQTKKEEYLVEATLKEKWYGTRYYFKQVSEELKLKISNFDASKEQVCDHPTGYPPENPFLPRSLSLLKQNEVKIPTLISKTNDSEIWFKPDTTFNRPKAIIYCQIYLDKGILPFEEYEAISYTWNLVIESKLKEISYMASEANLNFGFHFNNEGLFLKVTGFSDSMKSALDQLITAFKAINLYSNIELIKTQLEKHSKEMGNFYLSNPYSQLFAYFEYLRVEPSATPSGKLGQLLKLIDEKGEVKQNKFSYFIENFLEASKFLWVVQGNMADTDAIDIHNICSKLFKSNPLLSNKTISYRVVNQLPQTSFAYILNATNPKETNSSIISSFAWRGPATIKERILIALVDSLIKEKFFDSLRTNQGLGYIVQCFVREQRKIPSLLFLVQSNSKGPEYIRQKISEFIEEKYKDIQNLEDTTLQTHVQSLINEKKKKDTSLEEETVRNFNEIKKRDYTFDIRELMIGELEKVTKDEVLATFESLFIKEVRRLDLMFVASNHKEENTMLIKESKAKEEGPVKRYFTDSIEDYKRINGLHPDYFAELEFNPRF